MKIGEPSSKAKYEYSAIMKSTVREKMKRTLKKRAEIDSEILRF